MRKIFIFIWIILISFSTKANVIGKRNFHRVDSIAKNIEAVTSVQEQAKKITASFTSDEDKYRAIFTWVAHHIAYDIEALTDKTKRITDPKLVLSQKKAACGGYATLFKALCVAVDLPCERVFGWTKNYPTHIDNPLSDKPTHAWNAIKINNEWHLCDVTWAAGSIKNNSSFQFKFKDYYFCTPPALFAAKHFPLDEKWFLDAEMDEEKFVKAPHLYGHGVQLGVNHVSHQEGVLTYKQGRVVKFEFEINQEIEKVAIKSKASNKVSHVSFHQQDNKVSFSYEMTHYGEYLTIFFDNKGAVAYRLEGVNNEMVLNGATQEK